MQIREFVEIAGNATEVLGVMLIAGGLLLASGRLIVPANGNAVSRYQRYRHDVGPRFC